MFERLDFRRLLAGRRLCISVGNVHVFTIDNSET